MATCKQNDKKHSAGAAPPLSRPIKKYTFFNSYLGLVMIVLLFIAALLLGMLNQRTFLYPLNIASIAVQVCYGELLALAVALTSRAKGPDISVGAQMTLAAIVISRILVTSGSLVAGALTAIAICIVIGVINGVIAVYTKAPALAVTGGMYLVLMGISRVLSVLFRASFAAASPQSFTFPSWAPYAALPLAFATVFLLILLTRLRQSIYSREKTHAAILVIAYVLSGILAALAALLWQAGVPNLTQSPNTYLLLLPFLISGYITCSRLFDNGFMPAIIALLGTVFWTSLRNAFNLFDVAEFYQGIAAHIVFAAFGAVASVIWFSQRKAAKTHS